MYVINLILFMIFCYFFKQKTAYEMRISDWSSDVCSSDLFKPFAAIYSTFLQRAYDQVVHDVAIQKLPVRFAIDRAGLVGADGPTHAGARSEERRRGKECVSSCGSRWTEYRKKKNTPTI